MAEARERSRNRGAEIRQHAALLFRNQGYHATSMNDIAAAVQPKKGTLYHYYLGKANLLFEILLNTHDRRGARIHARPTDLSYELRVRVFIEETMMDLADNPIEGAVLF
jgi:AcrR family transcriptional regulator